MLFGFLFKSESITYVEAFSYIGYIVIAVSVIELLTRFIKKPTTEAATAPTGQVAFAD